MPTDDPRPKLLEKARSLPRVPGIYLMKDAAGIVLYIGKAAILPNRVASYFQPSADPGLKKQHMLDQVVDFDVIECETEWEALLTENRLIKDLHPKFNERLTDDKTFPYLAITLRDDYPGVYLTRDPNDNRFRGAKILGPFTSVYALREAVKIMQKVFKFRTCEMEILESDERRRFFRPCLLHPIKQCTAPCGDRISKVEYRADIDRFIRFLGSKRSAMLRDMAQEMEIAAAEKKYERAATLRDQIRAIEKLDDRGSIREGWQPETESFYSDPARGLQSLQRALNLEQEPRCVECIDIAHLQGTQTVGSKVCFVDGRPLKTQYRHFRIQTAENDDYLSIREVVSRAYREAGAGQELYPDVVIIDGGAGQLSAALEAFAQFERRPATVIALAKKEEVIFMADRDAPIVLGRENPGLKLCQAIRDEAHRFAQRYHHLLRRKRTFAE